VIGGGGDPTRRGVVSTASYTRDKTLPAPTRDPLVIRRAVFECLGRVKLDRRVRLLGVRVGELERG
jgi:hypothetical protein